MPVVLYHGTSHAFATAMAGMAPGSGAINVMRGEGEFGRGFYAQTSISNAMRWGQSRYGINSAAVLVLAIDDVAYHQLSFLRLTINQAQTLNARLRRQGAQSAYVTQEDVIEGPFVSQPRITQQKFQTVNAQQLLNGPQTQRTLRV